MDERIEDRRNELLLCNVADDIGANLAENNLCDYTMEMCGMTPKNKNDNKPTGPRTIPDIAFRSGADEHTSIEVEYVEPRLRKPISKQAAQESAPPLPQDTTKRKMLLQNLNEKAREDYKKEVRTSPQEFPDDEYAQNTIYNSFSQPEKRKFVKLISLNVTPTDAANQVLRERREGLLAAQEQAKSPSKKKGLRSFFSKKKITDEEEEEEPEMEKPEFSNSGINYYDAVRKVDADGYSEPEEENPAADKTKKNKKKKSILPSFKKKRFAKLSGVEPKSANANSTSPKNESSNDNSNNNNNNNNKALAAGAAVAGAAAVGAAAMASRGGDDENPEDEDWMPPPPPPADGASNNRALPAGAMLGASVMTEEEVLRDLAMSDTGEIREEKKIEDDMAAQLLGSMNNNNQGKMIEVDADEQELDDIDTYLKSTESNYGGVSLNPGNVPDHMTVGSYKTSATNATTSTRARRPGQAQRRMQQQKAAEFQRTRSGQQVRGWQETMQKAAAENNRTWDPQRGWVDYGDPNAPVPQYNPAESQQVDHRGTPQQAEHRGRGAAPMMAPTGQDQQGWAETMKAASARLAQAGKRWDPELGWVSTGASPDGKAVPRQDDGNVNTQSPSDTADFGAPGAGGLLEAEGQDEKLMIYEDENSESESQNKLRSPSPLVQVKKEKVDEDDAEYFSSPRGGPVDMDDHVEEEQQQEAPKSKGIPKLKGPKRDTSPVRGRRSAQGGTPGSGNDGDTRKSSEWKTFLAKKQAAEADRQDQDKQSEVASEASTAAMQGPNTFMGRLQACAAPILPVNRALNGTSPQSGSRIAALCGRPDMIHEENDGESITTENTPKEVRDRSRSRTRSSKSDVSSVISDEMSGSKAAFLESMAMKAVVSSKSKRRSTGSDAGSSVSYGQRSSLGASPSSVAGSASSTKWQQFLEKKKAENGGGSVVGARSQASSSISRAAEKYASKKAEEMMETQNSTPSGGSSFKPRPMEESTGAFPKPARIVTAPETPTGSRPQMLPFDTPKSSAQIAAEQARASRLSTTSSTPTRSRAHLPFEPQKSESQKAAEEAKAKRLNSLRASLSSPQD